MIKQLQPVMDKLDHELDSPLIRWSLLLIAICLFWSVVINPYFSWRSGAIEQIERQTVQIAKQQRAVDSLVKLRELEQDVKAINAGNANALLKETSDSSAQGGLMALLNPLIRNNDLKINGRRFDVGPVVPNLGAEVLIRLTLRGTTKQIMTFLDGVTQSDTLIVAKPVQIRTLQDATELQVTVSAYRKLPDSELKQLSQAKRN
ncbi:hypothetical protein ABT56_09855 [Photobacterium aquae]|uniref:Uncharacterized protein n=1 Tax=Photobacterium aquae TaxID=1195763 RepID=A0A0J1H217_9GAMM|nr:hypothetical protein [Photobacterium aquae]KLV05833.1 hypothetical protein ABT56_09855 [Photobacterium aquae]